MLVQINNLDDDEDDNRIDLISTNLDDTDDTISPGPNIVSKRSKSLVDRELRNLESTSPAGNTKSIKKTAGTRIRLPTLHNAKTYYYQIRDALQDELAEFNDQQYEHLSLDQQVGTDMNDRYRYIRRGKEALVMSADELTKILCNKYFSLEVKDVRKEVLHTLAKVSNIKLSYSDAFSVTSSTFRASAELQNQTYGATLNQSIAVTSIGQER